MIIKVRVKPSSKRQEIIKGEENNLVVYLKSAPKDNKANTELIKLLHKYFNKPVRIKSGLSSKNKIIEVEDN